MFRRLFTRINTPETPLPWGIVAALGAVVVSFAAVVIGTFIAFELLNDRQYTLLIAWTLGAFITIIFVFVRFAKPEERAVLRLGLNSTEGTAAIQQLFLMLLIGVGLSVALDVITGRVTRLFLPEPELLRLYTDVTLYQQPVQAITWIVAVAFMVIAQPIAEELVFRGVLLPSLRQVTGAWPGYILSVILYAVFHTLAFSQAGSGLNSLWYGQIVPFIAGLIFGAVRLYTGSTRAAILAHVGFGLFAIVKMLTLAG
jgi:membrane protease YdiL (CAAX protease family)